MKINKDDWSWIIFFISIAALGLMFIWLSACNEKDSIPLNSGVLDNEVTVAPAHIIVVIEENHSYDEIRGNPDAAYINSLADSGTLFTDYHGITHPSQPNYVAFFSGDQNGVTTDNCLAQKINAPNLYSKLKSAGKTCCWYSEGLPAAGSTKCKQGDYARKHNASSDFKNIPDSANKPFSEFPTDYNTLANLVIIVPNVIDDMHNGTVQQADDWINNNLGSLATWCKSNNSIFIITFDEDDHTTDNHIFTSFYGQNVLSNNVVADSLDHYNLTKTICSLFGAATAWTTNLQNRNVITGF